MMWLILYTNFTLHINRTSSLTEILISNVNVTYLIHIGDLFINIFVFLLDRIFK